MSAPTAAGGPAPWWLAYPDVWKAEAAALAAIGATWSRRSTLGQAEQLAPGADLGPRLALRISWPHPAPQPGDPDRLELLVRYPTSYPWFPPRVYLPEPLPGLVRHRNATNHGALCLLAVDDDWQPGATVAELLTVQLPRLLAAGRDPRTYPATLGLEAGAEPTWTRLVLVRGALLVDSACTPPAEVPGGLADLVSVGHADNPVHALVTLLDGDQHVLWAAGNFPLRVAARVPWVRLPTLPPGPLHPSELWHRGWAQLDATVPAATPDDHRETLVLLVPSERERRRPHEDFLLLDREAPEHRHEGRAGEAIADNQLSLFDLSALWPAPPASSAPAQAGARDDVWVTARRSYAMGPGDLTARLPDDVTRPMTDATVTVVGVGALGGPIALELARAGVGALRLVDGDTHDPATNARQLPGIRDAGDLKALAVATRLLEANPHVRLTCGIRDLGADDGRELPRLLRSSLVVDATASPTVTRFLAAHLRPAGTPLLIASATAGGWGGTIVTLPTAGGGCWECLQLHRADRAVPWPPARPDGDITPVGCSHPTYVGSYPDLGHVALHAARTALALLSADPAPRRATGRAPFGDLQVLSLHGPSGPRHPRWRARLLTVHPRCPLHGPHSGDVRPGSPPRRAP
jgi:ThiF family